MSSSNAVVDTLNQLQDELLGRAQAVEEFIVNYVKFQTPRHPTPKGKNDTDALAFLDRLSQQIHKARETVTATVNRAAGKLRQFRNSLVNINSLPDELLLSIFEHACKHELEEKMNVIVICRRWRDLCMSRPQFWAEFNARHYPRHGIARAIRYSRNHPLCVHVNHDDEKRVRRVIFANVQSIERLDVLLSQAPGQRKNVWLDKHWPVLRALDLQVHMSQGDVLAPPITGRVDKLRALTLQDVRFPYTPQCYSNLRFLRLMSDCPDSKHQSGGPRDGPLLDALRGSPNLQVLMLKDPPASADEVLLPRGAEAQPVTLPRLRLLSLVMSTQKASLLLRHLRTSPTVLKLSEVIAHRWRGEMGGDYGITDTRPIENIDKTLVLELPSPNTFPLIPRLQSLSIRRCDYQRVAGSLDALDEAFAKWISPYSRTSRDAHTDITQREPRLNFNVEYMNTRGTYMDADTLTAPAFDNFIRSVLRHHAPFGEMRVLRLDHVPSTDPLLRELAAAVPRLRTLVMHKCPSPAEGLNGLLGDGDGDASGPGPLPELATVVLVKCPLTVEDARTLSAATMRLGLRLVVVRAVKDGDPNPEEEDGEWREIVRTLRQDGAEVEVRYIKQWVYDIKFGIVDPVYWWQRDRAPYTSGTIC